MVESRLVSGQPRTKRGLRVLIIDPEPTSRIRLKDTLRGVEFLESIVEQSTAHQIQELAEVGPIHIILLDQELGSQEIGRIMDACRQDSLFSKTQFVLVAGEMTEDTEDEAHAMGIAGVVPKPFDLASIERALKAALAKFSAAQPKKLSGNAAKDTFERIRSISIFSGFSELELVRLLKICKTRLYPEGAFIFHEGDQGESLFVLISGRVDIRKKIEGRHKTLVTMGPGDCFGEMAIIDDEPRMADAVAASPCTVIEVAESVVNRNDDVISLKLVRQLAILLVKKLRRSSG